MKIDECTLENVHTIGGGETPPCAGLTPNVLPEAQSTISAVSSHTGVSTRNVHTGTTLKQQKQEETPHWYALRCTYGREKAAYDYFVAKGIIAFYPTTNAVKIINGKRKVVAESRLPNIFFALGTEEQIKTFVYDNVNLPFLRFYYRPRWLQNQQDTIDSPRLSDGKSEDYLCSRCGQYYRVVRRSAQVQERSISTSC